MKTDVIKLKNVKKSYLTSKGKYGMLRDIVGDNVAKILRKPPVKRPQVAAIDNITFSVKKGECLGIIGKNGAGKSTILKLISKITYPQEGQITVNGKIAAFIELGAGLHHELTGRENIFLYGAILGMKKREIAQNLNDIVNFAEIERFLDIPIKKYSSGMYSRLGFSVCAFSDPEILLVDEVLAVGDLEFQKRCLKKMHSFAGNKTIVFISHDMDAIRSICTRVLYMEKGKIIKSGKPQDMIKLYQKRGLQREQI